MHAIGLLLKTGTGLEGTAVKELLAKTTGIHATVRPRGMRGFIEARFPGERAGDVRRVLSRLRCFETAHVVLHEEKPPPGWLNTKRRAEAFLESIFAATFAALRAPDTCAASGVTRRGPFELAMAVPSFLRQRGFSQAQLQAIAARQGRAAGASILMKRKGTVRIQFKFFPTLVLGLVKLRVKPGNLPLPRIHPTGLFPNHAFGLIQHAFTALAANPATGGLHDGRLAVVDPMAGAGTILAMLVADAGHFIGRFPGRRLALTGIERDPAFHAKARANMQVFKPSTEHVESVNILHDDFSTLSLDPVDAIITQPPYGYSIPWNREDLIELHENLFSVADRWLHPGGVLAAITPRNDILPPIAKEKGWTIIASRDVQEHGTACKLLAYRRGDKHLV